MNTKICTDIEQSKKLIKLGLDVNTADMCHRFTWSNGSFILLACAEKAREPITGDIPAWSLAALLGFIKSEIYGKNVYGKTVTYKVEFRKYKFADDIDLYQIAYGSIQFDVDGQFSFKDMVHTDEKENLIDAAFEMICWLKENNEL
jgi:hypothetical protein